VFLLAVVMTIDVAGTVVGIVFKQTVSIDIISFVIIVFELIIFWVYLVNSNLKPIRI